MNTRFRLSAVVFLLMAPGWSPAMNSVEILSKPRAKELGLEIRSRAAGPDAVWVELEFALKGDLKDITHVDLEMWAGKTLLLSTLLRDRRPVPGRVAVGFTVRAPSWTRSS